MLKLIGFTSAAIVLAGLSVSAQAMPVAQAPAMGDRAAVTLVADGCGPYGHRSHYGFCKSDGPVYGAPVYAPRYERRCFIQQTYYGPRRVCR